MPLAPTAHRLHALRHGRSLANDAGIIVSRGRRALEWAELTPEGRDQAERAARSASLGPDTLVLTSDYARALQTARIVARIWGCGEPVADARLRERDFGSLEEGPDTMYDVVWAADAAGKGLPDGVESAEDVAARTRSVVEEALALPGARDIVLVAHGDVLQITQTWLAGATPRAHRSLRHLETGELRRLEIGDV